MRIAGLHLRSEQRLQPSIAGFVLAKLFEAPARTDGINVPLGKNGAEPGLQRTASMEVTEERPFRARAPAKPYNSEKRESARSQASAEPACSEESRPPPRAGKRGTW